MLVCLKLVFIVQVEISSELPQNITRSKHVCEGDEDLEGSFYGNQLGKNLCEKNNLKLRF